MSHKLDAVQAIGWNFFKMLQQKTKTKNKSSNDLTGVSCSTVDNKLENCTRYRGKQIEINRPRSIYQYSNMAPRLSGQTSIFGAVFFVSKSLSGIGGQKKLEKFAILTRKPRSHA